MQDVAITTTPSPATTTFVDPELGEGTPLLGSTIANSFGDDEDLEDIENWTKREKAVTSISAISFGSSVGAMMLSPTPVVLTAGSIGAVLAPYVAFQQQKITHVQALSETNKKIQEEVHQLQNENGKLQAQVADLTQSVQK
jgi:alpha/beta superfamily hydrolase